jgi:hypothetical protein
VKSTVQDACTQPLAKFELLLKNRIEPLKVEAEIMNKNLDIRLKELRLKAGKAKKEMKKSATR